MKFKIRLLGRIAKMMGVKIYLDVKKEEYELLLSIRNAKQQYVLLTDDVDIKKWSEINNPKYADEISEPKAEQISGAPMSKVAYNNLLHSLYRALDDTKLIPEGDGKKYVVSEILKSFKNCGLEIISYDGKNQELFEVKEDCDCKEPVMGTPTLREIKTGSIIIKGVLFIPER